MFDTGFKENLSKYAKTLSLNAETGVVTNSDKVVWRTKDTRKIVTGTVSGVKYTHDADGAGAGSTPQAVERLKVTSKKSSPDFTAALKIHNGVYYEASCVTDTGLADDCGADDVETNYQWVTVAYAESKKDEYPKPTYSVITTTNESVIGATATVTPTDTSHGYKATHVTAQFGLGVMTLALGHSKIESNDASMKQD